VVMREESLFAAREMREKKEKKIRREKEDDATKSRTLHKSLFTGDYSIAINARLSLYIDRISRE